MSVAHLRHNIQVKEEHSVPFFSEECCESRWDVETMGVERTMLWPIRCSNHNTQLKTWQRKDKFYKKWNKLFLKQYRRWRFVKMLTITLPGHLHLELRPGEDHQDYQIYLKNEILRRFKNLTRCKYWKDNVDGGQWFFECPITNLKCNPHFHIMLVGPKLINQVKLQEKLEHYNLGKIAKFSSPKTKTGAVQKMTYWKNRQLRPNKSAIKKAIYYCLKYVTKEFQTDGRNNSYFGNLYKK